MPNNIIETLEQSPLKSSATKLNDNASQKQHSTVPFYISARLFHNRRLKQKRRKWAVALAAATASKISNHQRAKTECRQQSMIARQLPDITIDLLSDEDVLMDSPPKQNCNRNNVRSAYLKPPRAHQQPKLPQPQSHAGQQFLIYPGQIELSKVPNITLIPVENLMRRNKRKRKAPQPKRHAQPTIVNNESIVLSDDDAAEKPLPAPCVSAALVPSPPRLSTPPAASTPMPRLSAQVDEEVTVSIVPRTSTAGSCSSQAANHQPQLIHMPPDETTVHTVIANRIYELSLTKLREGLAYCGIPEFADEQQKVSPTRRKGTVVQAPPVVTPPVAPISLKLSSDLSISLISDDEEEDEQRLHMQRMSAEKLLQKQPQLSVQHVQLPLLQHAPVRVVNNMPGQVPTRRRKLG